MKYVILCKDEGSFFRVFPVIFSEHMTHSTVGKGLTLSYAREEESYVYVLSAGFCYGGEGRWSARIGSESLKIPKQKEDTRDAQRDSRILNMFDAQQGIVYEI
jgi:hypothetical protein